MKRTHQARRNTSKKITIVGKTSRYMMKKLVEEKNSPVKEHKLKNGTLINLGLHVKSKFNY